MPKITRISPEEALADAFDDRTKLAARAYEAYEQTLRKSGALDFDDLLLRAVEVLRRFDDARAPGSSASATCTSTNIRTPIACSTTCCACSPAHSPISASSATKTSPSIAGAAPTSGNILRFAKDFPDARVFRIEQNYRSRQKILDAAAAVVSKNAKRIGKQLAPRAARVPILFFSKPATPAPKRSTSASGSANFSVKIPPRICAVMYRTNAQSRSLEEAFRARGIRYRLLGGFSFYQRAEIKDVLAYVRLAMFPDDDVALLRVLNTPPRGIGKITVESLRTLARERSGSLWSALGETVDSGAAAPSPPCAASAS